MIYSLVWVFHCEFSSNDWALILYGFAIQVSKDWHKLCFDGQLWKTLDATGYYDRIPVDQLSKIITTAGPFVRNLNLRYSPQSTGAWGLHGVC